MAKFIRLTKAFKLEARDDNEIIINVDDIQSFERVYGHITISSFGNNLPARNYTKVWVKSGEKKVYEVDEKPWEILKKINEV